MGKPNEPVLDEKNGKEVARAIESIPIGGSTNTFSGVIVNYYDTILCSWGSFLYYGVDAVVSIPD